MSTRFTKRAGDLQASVRLSEQSNLDSGVDQYRGDQVKQAIVHTRQDLIMVVSYLDTLNEQVASIKWLLTGIFIAVLAMAWHILK